MMLENSLFSRDGEPNEDFVEWSGGYELLVHVTSHVYTDEYHDLFSERGGLAWPYLAFLDQDGHVLAQHDGPNTVEGLEESAGRAREMARLAAKARTGDAEAAREVFLARLRMEALSFEEALASFEQLGDELSGDQWAAVQQLLVNKELTEEMGRLQREHGSAFMRELPARAAEFLRAGKMPTNRLARHFFAAVLRHAEREDDRDLAEQLVHKAEELFGDQPAAARMLEQGRDALRDWGG